MRGDRRGACDTRRARLRCAGCHPLEPAAGGTQSPTVASRRVLSRTVASGRSAARANGWLPRRVHGATTNLPTQLLHTARPPSPTAAAAAAAAAMAAQRLFLLLAAAAAAFVAFAPDAVVANHEGHEHDDYPIANVTIADFAHYLLHEFATDADSGMMTLEDFERMMVATGVLAHADDEHGHGHDHDHDHDHDHEHNHGLARTGAAPEARRQPRSRHRPVPASAADLEELAEVCAPAPLTAREGRAMPPCH